MFIERMVPLVFIVTAIAPAPSAPGDIAWSDSPAFTMNMFCPATSDTGKAWDDSPVFTLEMFCPEPTESGLDWSDSAVFTLEMFCQEPSDGGKDWDDSGVFALQFGDLDALPRTHSRAGGPAILMTDPPNAGKPFVRQSRNRRCLRRYGWKRRI